MYGYGHMGGWGMGWVFELFFLGLFVWGLVMLFRHGRGGCCGRMRHLDHQRGGGGESALDILKKRYVSGEITREEFEQMKKEIE